MGRLIVFEGPDAVGKTTVAAELAKILSEEGKTCLEYSFPGREEGTLGAHVYQIHHALDRFAPKGIAPLSLQLLHIATHIDAIHRILLEATDCYDYVILDRYWWSTWVYGKLDKISEEELDAAISVERVAWKHILPSCLFLLSTNQPLRVDTSAARFKLIATIYAELARMEQGKYPIYSISNSRSLDETVGQIIREIQNNVHAP